MDARYLNESLAGAERLLPTCRNAEQRDYVRDFATHLAREWPDPDATVIARFLALGVSVGTFIEAANRDDLRAALAEFDATSIRLNLLLRQVRVIPEPQARAIREVAAATANK